MFRVVIALASLLSVFSFQTGPRSRVSSSLNAEKSIALPFDSRPPNLDGTLPGDVGELNTNEMTIMAVDCCV